MAKVPILKSDVKVSEDLRSGLERRGGITHWSFDSTARIFADTIATEISRNNAESRRAFEALQLSSAAGEDLELAGFEWAGLRRKNAASASVQKKHKNLYFYVQTQAYGNQGNGTFGDINGGGDIVIPAGTRISTDSVIDSSGSVVYTLDENVTLPAGSALVYCSATAVTMGAAMNCSSNALRYHNFTNYTDSGFNALKCNNRYPILSGTDRERDSSLRYRIVQYIPSIVQNNLSKIKLSGLNIPGIEDVIVINGYFGIGSAAVIALGIEDEVTPQLTQRLQMALSHIQGPGLEVVVIPAVRVYFDFDARVLVTRTLSVSEELGLKRTLANALVLKLKEYEITNTIDFSVVAQAIASSHPLIAGLISRRDSPNDNRKAGFESVYVKRAWSNQAINSERKRIIQNRFTLKGEEVVSLGDINITIVTKA